MKVRLHGAQANTTFTDEKLWDWYNIVKTNICKDYMNLFQSNLSHLPSETCMMQLMGLLETNLRKLWWVLFICTSLVLNCFEELWINFVLISNNHRVTLMDGIPLILTHESQSVAAICGWGIIQHSIFFLVLFTKRIRICTRDLKKFPQETPVQICVLQIIKGPKTKELLQEMKKLNWGWRMIPIVKPIASSSMLKSSQLNNISFRSKVILLSLKSVCSMKIAMLSLLFATRKPMHVPLLDFFAAFLNHHTISRWQQHICCRSRW